MILSYREPWTEQPPQFDAVIDLSNPLVPGLVFDLGPPSTRNFFNTVDGKKATRSPGVSLSPQKYGSGHTVTAANDNCIDFSTYPILTTFPYSILVVTDAKNEAVRQWVFSTRRLSGFFEMVSLGLNAARDGSGSVATAGSLFLYTVDNTGTFSCPTTGAAGAVQDGVHHYGATCDASGNVSYYVDGKLYGTNTQANNNSTFHSGQETRVGAFASTTNSSTNTRSQLITRVWNGRLLAEADFKAQFDNPFGIYLPKTKLFWIGAGAGGGADLAGTAAAQASASGTLSVQVPLVGAATTSATATGTITTQVPLSGAATVQASASGSISVTVALTGAALANALASGALSTQVALSGSALASALASGDLLAGGAGALAGNAVAQVSASGALSISVPLAGSASALAIAAGGLTTAVPLAGVSVVVVNASGDLLIAFNALAGSAAAQVLAAGTLSIQVPLSGTAIAQALATGYLGNGVLFVGSIARSYSVSMEHRFFLLEAEPRSFVSTP